MHCYFGRPRFPVSWHADYLSLCNKWFQSYTDLCLCFLMSPVLSSTKMERTIYKIPIFKGLEMSVAISVITVLTF